jgi:hypothetical protein
MITPTLIRLVYIHIEGELAMMGSYIIKPTVKAVSFFFFWSLRIKQLNASPRIMFTSISS